MRPWLPLISTTVSHFANFPALPGDLPLVGQTAELFTGYSENHHYSVPRRVLEWGLYKLVHYLGGGSGVTYNTGQYLAANGFFKDNSLLN